MSAHDARHDLKRTIEELRAIALKLEREADLMPMCSQAATKLEEAAALLVDDVIPSISVACNDLEDAGNTRTRTDEEGYWIFA